MPLLDIEKAIKENGIGSRFRLVSIASQRARELNSPKDWTHDRRSEEYVKFTTTALDEIIKSDINFSELSAEEFKKLTEEREEDFKEKRARAEAAKTAEAAAHAEA